LSEVPIANSPPVSDRFENKKTTNDSVDSPATNIDEAIKRMPGGKPAVRQLAIVFLAECNSLVNELNRAVLDDDTAKVQRLAHTLKGSAKLFLADRLVDSSLQLELAAVHRHHDQFSELLSAITRDEACVREEVEAFLASE
jgi:HPt (histidine-containing phosphotransfer) domain-containing protein